MNQIFDKTQPENFLECQTYTVNEISTILGVALRTAYQLCKTTSEFKVINIGRCVRVSKESFDNWFGKGEGKTNGG